MVNTIISFEELSEESILADLQSIAQDLGLIDEVFEQSRINIYYSVFARVFGSIVRVFSQILNEMNIDYTTDEALLNSYLKFLITKREATASKTLLRFRRRDMTQSQDTIIIPEGLEVNNEGDGANHIRFRTAISKIFPKDWVEVFVPAYSIDLGVRANVPANTIVYVDDPIFGDIEITNLNPAFGGTNEESAFEARNRLSQFRYAKDGSATQIRGILASLGIYAEQINLDEFFDGWGSYGLFIDIDNPDHFDEIKSQFNLRRTEGIRANIQQANRVYANFYVRVELTGLDENYFNATNVRELYDDVDEAISLYFMRSIYVGTYLSLKRLQAYVLNYLNEENDFEINGITITVENEGQLLQDIDIINEVLVVNPYDRIYANKVVTDIEHYYI